MKLALLLLLTPLLALAYSSAPDRDLPEPVTRARTEIRIPNPTDLITLKCDFHIHTVFSDGLVWPSVRADEAWRQGLDAIAITDHLEYQPHKDDLPTNHNRSTDIARGTGEPIGVIVIRGSEITRQMPPGHFNAIFLTNCNALSVSNWTDAIAAAHAQDAFIFWNHPGWERQATNGIAVWYPEHTQIYESGMMQGIEVVNGRSYCPEAHRWAIEKKLAMMSDSDIHAPINMDYQIDNGDRRPMTLVFAKERTPESIKEALRDRRTAAYAGGFLVGDERFLRPIFEKSIQIKNASISIRGKGRALVQIANESSIDFHLARAEELPDVDIPKEITLPAGKTVILEVKGTGSAATGEKPLALPYAVRNLLIGPDQALPVTIDLTARFTEKP
ncbi:MAG TPA: Sb-PDE family phosphodiesterase [Verrucomicrobiae bacterium]|nr:Sb-PDE family phosphodiesterase [Verrucomicrobiae bacterium]